MHDKTRTRYDLSGLISQVRKQCASGKEKGHLEKKIQHTKLTLSERKRLKYPCVSYSNEQVKAALEKIQTIHKSEDNAVDDDKSDDSSSVTNFHQQKLGDSELQSNSIAIEDTTPEMSDNGTEMTSDGEDETIQDGWPDKKCCFQLKTKIAKLQRDLASAEDRYPKLLRDNVKLMKDNAERQSDNVKLMRENTRLIEELAAAEERYHAERRLREELEDNLFIMPGNSEDK